MVTRVPISHEPAQDVVFLLPGFFGFAQVGQFFYYADRVAAVLESALWTRLGRRVPVCLLTTEPTDPLRDRQAFLEDQLLAYLPSDNRGQLNAAPDARIHLVGHSTGGLDAWLLLARTTLSGAPWSHPMNRLRERIRSVHALAAPFYGTRVTLSPFARALAAHSLGALLSVGHLKDVLTTGLEVLGLGAGLLAQPTSLIALALGSVVETPDGREDAVKLLFSVCNDRGLLADLKPDAMAELHRRVEVDHVAEVTCYVTVPADGLLRDPDSVESRCFDLMYREASGPYDSAWAAAAHAAETRLAHGLRQGTLPVIGHPGVTLRAVDGVVSDGIVNSCAQWLEGAALGAVVVAGHIDLIGHYRRVLLEVGPNAQPEPQVVNRGLLDSGSWFGDPELTRLYGAIAASIAAKA